MSRDRTKSDHDLSTAVTKHEDRPIGLGGFDTPPTSMVEREAGAVGVVAREEAEIKAAIVLARNFPRDEQAAFAKMMRSANRASFAEDAVYSYPRGGERIEGPSVKLAREAARCWGNIRYGLRLVSIDDDYVHVKGWALDLETNSYDEIEDKFERLVYRKKGGWIKPDERDLRELVNRRGAICVRNALLQILPPDIVDELVRRSKETMEKAARGELEQDRTEAIRRIAIAFDRYGVSVEMLTEYLGHDLDSIDETELADLRSVWTSIRDGNTRVDDHFERRRRSSVGSAELNEAIQQRAKNRTQNPEEEEEEDGPPSESQLGQLEGLIEKAAALDVGIDVPRYADVLVSDSRIQVRDAIRGIQQEIAHAGGEVSHD